MRLPTDERPATPDRRDFAKIRGRICRQLEKIAVNKPNYWNFRADADAVISRKLFQYPAMMVPALQKQVIAAMLKARPNTTTLFDPFMGSGTILALAMLNGRSFIGQDVNPLAILIAKTRAFSLDYEALTEAVNDVVKASEEDCCSTHEVQFVGQSKWFTRGGSLAFTKLRRAIRLEASIASRRFLWVCLAETIRLNSNSRTSTFKLHVKPVEQQNATEHGTLKEFGLVAARNLLIVEQFAKDLQYAGYIKNGKYIHNVQIDYGDTTKRTPKPDWEQDNKVELVVTSPPYGDNRTTVPYGQASWLPLQWIDISDIDRFIPRDAAKQAYDVDNRSLGGIRSAKLLAKRRDALKQVGPRTAEYIATLEKVSKDGLSRFVHFAFDMQLSMNQVVTRCRDGASVVMTTGHRNISGTICPLTDVCREILGMDAFKEVVRIDRQIQSKRMAKKNGHSATITHEYITILRKVAFVTK